MINIKENASNEFVLYLNSEITIKEPYFIFEFIDNYNNIIIKTLPDITPNPSYNLFSITEGSTITLQASGKFNVYESLIDTDVIEDLHLIYNSTYKFIQDKEENKYIFIPDSNNIEYVYQPVFTEPYSTTDGIFQTTDGNFQVVEGDFQVNE